MFTLLLALITPSAHAIQVNDQATYHYTANHQTEVMKLRVSKIEEGLFYTETTEAGAAPSMSRASVSAYEQTMGQILTRCEAAGGKLELTTVPAGIFHTCHTSYVESDHYMSPEVPFAMVKMYYHSGDVKSEIELQSFTVAR